MAGEPLSGQMRQLVESILEDERLRADLTDEEGSTLLNWGIGQLESAAPAASAAAQGDDQAAAQKLGATAQRVRATMRAINDLVAERSSLTPAELAQRVGEVQAACRGAGGPAAAPASPAAMARLSRAGSNVEFIRQLTATLTGPDAAAAGGPAQTHGGSESGRSPVLLAAILGLVLLVIIVGFLALRGGRQAPTTAEAPAAGPAPQAQPAVTQVTAAPRRSATPAQVPGATTSAKSASTPAAAPGWYQVWFTAPQFPDNPATHHGSLDARLTDFINTAQHSVDIAIYQLDLANVTNALLAAKKRGCVVRAVTDIDESLDDPKHSPRFKELQAAGIVVVGGNPNAIMHDKFVVVDGKAVWAGAWNFTDGDTYRYNNNAILIQSPQLAHNYTVEFEKMWKDKTFGASKKPGGTTPRLTINGTPVENYFAPEDKVAEKILPRLQGAQKTIDFLAFSFTDDDLGNAVTARAKAGVKVRGVFETSGSETQYSEYGKLKAARLDVLQDGNPYFMHHKVFIIDGKTVVLGSFNFSQNAENSNDENLLIIDDSALAAQFTAEFERVYAVAKNPPKSK